MKFTVPVVFIILLLCVGCFAQSQSDAPKAPMVPMSIATPEGHSPFFKVHAKGFQDYACSSAKGAPGWTLTGPDAQLYGEKSEPIGKHFAVQGFGAGASPSWKLDDGSEIVGEKISAVDAPDGKGVQWLLLKVIQNQKKGILADALYVQRVETVGGKPPAEGCTASTVGAKTQSPYTAEYYFSK